MADQMCAQGEHVIFFTLEQGRYELVAKSIARITAKNDINAAYNALDIRRGIRSPEIIKAAQEYQKIAGNMTIVECSFDTNIKQIREYVDSYISNSNGIIPVIIVDYIQIIPPSDVRQSDREKLDQIVRGLKKLQMEYQATIIVISSVNRASYNIPISFESFKESGGIEYGSDMVLGLQLQILKDTSYQKANVIAKKFMIDAAKGAIPRKVELTALKNRYDQSNFSCGFTYYPQYDFFVPDKSESREHSPQADRFLRSRGIHRMNACRGDNRNNRNRGSCRIHSFRATKKGIGDSTDRRSGNRCDLKGAGVPGNCIGEVFFRNQLRQKRAAGRPVEAAHDAEENQHDIDKVN
jgi:hypothetical protein